MKLTVITHYPKSDPQFWGDYYDIEIVDEDGKQIVEYGDYYHEKGQEKIEGFLAGVRFMSDEKVEVERKNVADREC